MSICILKQATISLGKIKKLYLLNGYDFEHIVLDWDLHILCNGNDYVILNRNNLENVSLAKIRSCSDTLNLENKDLRVLHPQIINLFKNIRRLNFDGNAIKDISSLSNAQLPNLEILKLEKNKIKDISALSNLNSPNLSFLSLYHNRIKDISSLADCNWPNLRMLSLSHNKISNISALHKFKNLMFLYVIGSSVPRKEIKSFREQLPNCRIYGRI